MTTDQTNYILDRVKRRIESHGVTAGKGKKALTLEADMLAGAMIAINALFPNDNPNQMSAEVPPFWIIAPMCGRSVFNA